MPQVEARGAAEVAELARAQARVRRVRVAQLSCKASSCRIYSMVLESGSVGLFVIDVGMCRMYV